MKNVKLIALALVAVFLLSAGFASAQTQKKQTAKASIEIIQFHSEHRCITCNKIEELTRETLKSYPSIPFSLVNVDDDKNEKKCTQFEATGTALFLYNPKTGKKQDLTDFAFMNAQDKEKFIEGLKKHIDDFQKL